MIRTHLKKPISYKHPAGAIIWVKPEGAVEKAIRRDSVMQQSEQE